MTQEQKDFLAERLITAFKKGTPSRQLVTWLMEAGVVVYDKEKHEYLLVGEEE